MKKFNILPAFILILTMFAVAEYTGQKEIIFPEISALALGAWIMEKPPWGDSAFDFWLSPTLAALTGVLMVRFFSYVPVFMIGGAFCLVVLQLKFLRSNVLPSISAAILAIITRSDSWLYPLSVCIMTGMIAFGRYAVNRVASGEKSAVFCEKPALAEIETRSELVYWGKLFAGVMAVVSVAAFSGRLFMVAPPLIVAFVELSKPGGVLQDKWLKILGLLAFAAFGGVFCFALIHTVLHLPLWIVASASTASVFWGYHLLQLPFPPAVAISLLPTILPHDSLWSYPWQVLAGSGAFVMISKVCFAQAEQTPAIESVSPD